MLLSRLIAYGILWCFYVFYLWFKIAILQISEITPNLWPGCIVLSIPLFVMLLNLFINPHKILFPRTADSNSDAADEPAKIPFGKAFAQETRAAERVMFILIGASAIGFGIFIVWAHYTLK